MGVRIFHSHNKFCLHFDNRGDALQLSLILSNVDSTVAKKLSDSLNLRYMNRRQFKRLTMTVSHDQVSVIIEALFDNIVANSDDMLRQFGKLGVDRSFNDVISPSGDFGVDSNLLVLIRDIFNDFDKSCSDSYLIFVAHLIQNYYRHLNSLNILINNFFGSRSISLGDVQLIVRSSFELSVYIKYILLSKSLEEFKSKVHSYQLSNFQEIASFASELYSNHISLSNDSEFLKEFDRNVVSNYLSEHRLKYASSLGLKKLSCTLKKDAQPLLYHYDIDTRHWYHAADDGNSSFRQLVLSLSKNDPSIIDDYCNVYLPCCYAIHSVPSSYDLPVNVDSKYPSFKHSSQDFWSYWVYFFALDISKIVINFNKFAPLNEDKLKDIKRLRKSLKIKEAN